MHRPGSFRAVFAGALGGLLLALAVPALAAASAGVIWRLDSNMAPTVLVPGQPGRIIATASNLGDESVQGAGAHPVVISDRLPAHLVVAAGGLIEARLEANDRSEAASSLACSVEEPARKQVSCATKPTTQPLAPYTQLRVTIPVQTSAEASGEATTVTVSGGETAGEPLTLAPSITRPVAVGENPTPFGVERYELAGEEEDGTPDARAGSHPFQLTTTLDLNEALTQEGAAQAALEPAAPALARNLSFQLPPGLLGDPQAVAQCPDVDFSSIGENNVNACPADTAVGVALVTLNLPAPPLGVFTEAVPVFNLTPAPGEPARFGLEDTKVPIILDTSVRTGGDYGVTVTVHDTSQAAQLLASRVTLWGEPDVASHDASRGWACLRGKEVNGETCQAPAQRSAPPFLTLPTSCPGGLATTMAAEAWTGASAQASYQLQNAQGQPLTGLEGCGLEGFTPALEATPVDEQAAPASVFQTGSQPAGLNVTVGLPVEASGLGESAVRSSTVTLPVGMLLNPAAANGLEACSEQQVGFEGPAPADPLAPGVGEPPAFSPAPAECPKRRRSGWRVSRRRIWRANSPAGCISRSPRRTGKPKRTRSPR